MPLGSHKFASFSLGDADGPVWTTAAGALGTFRPGRTILSQSANITLQAADEAGNGENFAITSGSLPGGLSMADNGDGTATISGTPEQVTASAVATFTVTASDDNGNESPRVFTITIEPNYWGDSSDGAYDNEND